MFTFTSFINLKTLIMRPLSFSFYSPTLSVRGERPCCGIMIGGSLRSSHSSSLELLVSALTSRAGNEPRDQLCPSPAASGVDLGLYLHTIFKSSGLVLQEGTGVRERDARAAIMIGPTIATNLLSTLLIWIQAW